MQKKQDNKKKATKQSKVRDLKPKKDAKGGMRKAGIIAVGPSGAPKPTGSQGPQPDITFVYGG
jgi:hypothetical protein